MKKLIILILILSLMLGVFVSCSEDAPPIDDLTVDSSRETSSETSAETSSETTTEIIETTTESETVMTDTSDTFETTVVTESEETTSKESNSYPDEYNYTIEKIGEQYYMIFDTYETPPHSGSGPRGGIYFESLKAFKDRFSDTETQEGLLIILIEFDRDEIGIPILDFNSILSPILPDNTKVDGVEWFNGNEYEISFTSSEQSTEIRTSGSMSIKTKEFFDERYSNTAPSNVLKNDEKTIIVDRISFSSSLYNQVFLNINQGDFYVQFTLYNVPENVSDEYFLSFGVEEYVAPAEN